MWGRMYNDAKRKHLKMYDALEKLLWQVEWNIY